MTNKTKTVQEEAELSRKDRLIVENLEKAGKENGFAKEAWEDIKEVMDQKIEKKVGGLTSAVKEGFEEMGKQFEAINKQFEEVGKQFEEVGKQFEAINKRLDAVDHRFDLLEARIKGVEERFERNEVRVDKQLREQKEDMKDVLQADRESRKETNERLATRTSITVGIIALFITSVLAVFEFLIK